MNCRPRVANRKDCKGGLGLGECRRICRFDLMQLLQNLLLEVGLVPAAQCTGTTLGKGPRCALANITM